MEQRIKQSLLFIAFLSLSLWSFAAVAESIAHDAPLRHAHIDLRNKASLQRGARLYINYCAACHSMKYLRYNQMAKGIGLVDDDGKVDVQLLIENLIFTSAKPHDPITNAMADNDAREWFGVVPPDLTLIARVRGADWLYTYLTSFYRDRGRPFGSNNWLFPEVGMPNVLRLLQGEQIPVIDEKTVPYNGGTKQIKIISDLQLLAPGSMTQHQFKSSINDLVNFLVFAAHPMRLQSEFIGVWALIFLFILLVLVYLLKKAFWEDIH